MTFLLAHLSDAHIGPLPRPHLRELLGKRLTGYVNWNRRGRLHDMDVLADLVADIKAQAPDHIAMTGDILNLGLAAEFPFAAQWLRDLGPSRDVSFVPGNHDAYVRSSMGPLAATFVPWLADLSAIGAPLVTGLFPYLRQRGDVALIGVSSALPTAPFLASGALGSTQRQALGTLLADAGRRKVTRIVMIHHPPYRAGASAGRGLRDASAFARIIAEHGAELILHGHNHRAMLAHLPGPNGLVPVVGVPAASAVPGSPNHRAAYHLFRIGLGANGLEIAASRRGLLPDLSAIGDLGPIDLAEGGLAAIGL
ncbi:metallophosphoesterase family protein [Lichenihabitans psoromatis]|uniref:metallophosphoesterase family protein n=1 Tax=Lichenihabitans psoromatis TaxID=2528642 RepID=UPI0010385C9F|nr:metallophosphoesterase [Lichenihabitans psoromatis]